MDQFFNQRHSMFFAAIISPLIVISSPAQTLGQSGHWKKQWEMTIRAAKKEGKLVFHSGNSAEPYFEEFRKKFPEIKIVRMLTRGGSAAHQRLMAERRAKVYIADIVHLGRGSGSRLAKGGALDPRLRPIQVLLL